MLYEKKILGLTRLKKVGNGPKLKRIVTLSCKINTKTPKNYCEFSAASEMHYYYCVFKICFSTVAVLASKGSVDITLSDDVVPEKSNEELSRVIN